MKPWLRLAPLLICLFMIGCATTPPSETGTPGPDPDRQPDGPPANPPDLSHVIDPEPKWEPPSRWGNPSSYEVFGVTYEVMDSIEQGYTEEGIASWYGKKFHGRRTSSGETYDMYAMTAAHKHLPIPVYVRVTNLENDKQIIVRVNDRGPFARNRIIDLSYAAAYRLDMLDRGTAPVRIEVIATEAPANMADYQAGEPPVPAKVEPNGSNIFVQAGAFSQRGNAERLRTQLQNAALDTPVEIQAAELERGSVYRVRLGPVRQEEQLAQLTARLAELGINAPQVLRME
ncbi:hypothetical protein CAI21_01185 [Alkalilimnicola ehrlichii]|uniref:Endolytic peptidoglycan transglycosylase RlpA n=1 Tax=Alkalilimnicola ehrlichii TaxID=351052 RepID=A0A3E0X4I1_9GAMM|nr:septal ring lytic transglycosylase RlpA family protein [Alkalilimnicola ehrlichii]RFA31281.1 hypothetical protein CAI21_01185 [Alkalilimnicola ehrlichii]RFA39446.1 hypothetical protein CAL65_01230 [Alkalilimnicola ehrlichii]